MLRQFNRRIQRSYLYGKAQFNVAFAAHRCNSAVQPKQPAVQQVQNKTFSLSNTVQHGNFPHNAKDSAKAESLFKKSNRRNVNK